MIKRLKQEVRGFIFWTLFYSLVGYYFMFQGYSVEFPPVKHVTAKQLERMYR